MWHLLLIENWIGVSVVFKIQYLRSTSDVTPRSINYTMYICSQVTNLSKYKTVDICNGTIFPTYYTLQLKHQHNYVNVIFNLYRGGRDCSPVPWAWTLKLDTRMSHCRVISWPICHLYYLPNQPLPCNNLVSLCFFTSFNGLLWQAINILQI